MWMISFTPQLLSIREWDSLPIEWEAGWPQIHYRHFGEEKNFLPGIRPRFLFCPLSHSLVTISTVPSQLNNTASICLEEMLAHGTCAQISYTAVVCRYVPFQMFLDIYQHAAKLGMPKWPCATVHHNLGLLIPRWFQLYIWSIARILNYFFF